MTTTYFRDFPVTDRVPLRRARAHANSFATHRHMLGHNVRRMRTEADAEAVVYRIYFSPTPINLKEAVRA